MSAYPVMLDGTAIVALVVGGGAVATRKVRGLLDAGASVHVVAADVAAELEALATDGGRLRVTRAAFAPTHLDGATLVLAATNDAAVNAAVAGEARARGLPVNVADAPDLGTFVTPAVHRAGDVVVAVSAGGVPAVAGRIRDAVARMIDGRYGAAVRELSSLRRSMLDAGERERWHAASRVLASDEFCMLVETGSLAARIDEWR